MKTEIENTTPTNVTEGALALKNTVAIPGQQSAPQLMIMAARNKVKPGPLVLANAQQCQPHAPIYTTVMGNNSELIKQAAALYLKPDNKIADITWGRGVFWKLI